MLLKHHLHLLLAAGTLPLVRYHADQVLRDSLTGWPFVSDVTAFSFTFLVYPLILLGFTLDHRRGIPYEYWFTLSGVGALGLLLAHRTPWSAEPIPDLVSTYDPAMIGGIALGWLLLFIACLIHTSWVLATLWRIESYLRH